MALVGGICPAAKAAWLRGELGPTTEFSAILLRAGAQASCMEVSTYDDLASEEAQGPGYKPVLLTGFQVSINAAGVAMVTWNDPTFAPLTVEFDGLAIIATGHPDKVAVAILPYPETAKVTNGPLSFALPGPLGVLRWR